MSKEQPAETGSVPKMEFSHTHLVITQGEQTVAIHKAYIGDMLGYLKKAGYPPDARPSQQHGELVQIKRTTLKRVLRRIGKYILVMDRKELEEALQ